MNIEMSELNNASICSDSHCITCSDEAIEAAVVGVDQDMLLATVQIEQETAEIDISLIDEVAIGDRVLMHGGVAIAKL